MIINAEDVSSSEQQEEREAVHILSGTTDVSFEPHSASSRAASGSERRASERDEQDPASSDANVGSAPSSSGARDLIRGRQEEEEEATGGSVVDAFVDEPEAATKTTSCAPGLVNEDYHPSRMGDIAEEGGSVASIAAAAALDRSASSANVTDNPFAQSMMEGRAGKGVLEEVEDEEGNLSNTLYSEKANSNVGTAAVQKEGGRSQEQTHRKLPSKEETSTTLRNVEIFGTLAEARYTTKAKMASERKAQTTARATSPGAVAVPGLPKEDWVLQKQNLEHSPHLSGKDKKGESLMQLPAEATAHPAAVAVIEASDKKAPTAVRASSPRSVTVPGLRKEDWVLTKQNLEDSSRRSGEDKNRVVAADILMQLPAAEATPRPGAVAVSQTLIEDCWVSGNRNLNRSDCPSKSNPPNAPATSKVAMPSIGSKTTEFESENKEKHLDPVTAAVKLASIQTAVLPEDTAKTQNGYTTERDVSGGEAHPTSVELVVDIEVSEPSMTAYERGAFADESQSATAEVQIDTEVSEPAMIPASDHHFVVESNDEERQEEIHFNPAEHGHNDGLSVPHPPQPSATEEMDDITFSAHLVSSDHDKESPPPNRQQRESVVYLGVPLPYKPRPVKECHQNYKKIIIVTVLVLIVVAVVVPVVLTRQSSSTTAASASVSLEAFVGMLSSKEALGDNHSPQSVALRWLIEEDEIARLSPRDHWPLLLQRYALAVLYYSTGGQLSWLEDFGFLSTDHECTWGMDGMGVVCDDSSKVIELNLGSNNLTGTIPDLELAAFPKLNILDMASNQLHGDIPSKMTNLISLRSIFVQQNALGGKLDDGIGSLQSLVHLDVSRNRLTSTVPTSIGKLTSLKLLDFRYNQISGTIPSTIGDMSEIEFLRLSYNRLSSTIPTSWNSLHNVEEFLLHGNDLIGTLPIAPFCNQNVKRITAGENRLTGTIPSALGTLQNLEIVLLEKNRFEGKLPDSLTNLTNLDAITLSDNQLTGTIPDILCIGSLRAVVLGNNKLTGTLPSAIGNPSNMLGLAMENNLLTGTIPSSFGNLTNLQYGLSLHSNLLSGTIPSSIGLNTQSGLLALEDNLLTGTVPRSLAGMERLSWLSLARNGLTGDLNGICAIYKVPQELMITADCGPPNPEVECECCQPGFCCRDGVGSCNHHLDFLAFVYSCLADGTCDYFGGL